MMLRLRKYRIFLLVALFFLTTVWYLSRDASWSDIPPLTDSNDAVADFQAAFSPNGQQNEQESTPQSEKLSGQTGGESSELESDPLLHPNNGVAGALAQETAQHTSTKSTAVEDATTASSVSEQVASLVQVSTTKTATSTSTSNVVERTSAAPPIPHNIPDVIYGTMTSKTMGHSSYAEPTNTWVSRTERFPVSFTIKLPTGTAKAIPRIQHVFGLDTPMIKNERKYCLDQIRKAMKRTWSGYRQYAWMKDELKPVSKGYHDKFMGWAATLVDSLDTLWIMGLEREFEEAVNATATINFKESIHSRIPMFETTIRYLGGLLGAYDISGGEHKVLLEKAVELADVLMSAFDTPNRMPILYYNFAAKMQPERASRASCLAEIGSLSLEFTRLAQLTGESRYYDAIARITDALADYQMKTTVPGLWPLHIDTSGCKQPKQRLAPQRIYRPLKDEILLDNKDHSSFGDDSSVLNTTMDDSKTPAERLREQDDHSFAADTKASGPERPRAGSAVSGSTSAAQAEKHQSSQSISADSLISSSSGSSKASEAGQELKEKSGLVPDARISKRQLGTAPTTMTGASSDRPPANNSGTNSNAADDQSTEAELSLSYTDPDDIEEDCPPAGFQTGNFGLADHFTLGGEADSTYEYLPKQYLLLGGNEDKYRTMYEAAMQATKKFLLFRPMQEDNQRELLFTGEFSPNLDAKNITSQADGSLNPDMGHLACFVGGMLALGSKIFDRPEDLEIAAKVTDACVWAYGATTSGVMPETFRPLVCDSIDKCSWNESAWHEALDPYADQRLQNYQTRLEYYENATATTTTTAAADLLHEPMPGAPPAVPSVKLADFDKRQLDLSDESKDSEEGNTQDTDENESNGSQQGSLEDDLYTVPEPIIKNPIITPTKPMPPLSHSEYVSLRLKDEGLWPGALRIIDRRYILRPEAIESVFYMYRITGDQTWRRKGLKMWMALEKATATEYGNSAINDVTLAKPEKDDEMESFWPAETLKYFYLLFSEQDSVSLDDWVFNTEAHPFKRSDAQLHFKGPHRGPNHGAGTPAMQEIEALGREQELAKELAKERETVAAGAGMTTNGAKGAADAPRSGDAKGRTVKGAVGAGLGAS